MASKIRPKGNCTDLLQNRWRKNTMMAQAFEDNKWM
jgi:hypothetical protein